MGKSRDELISEIHNKNQELFNLFYLPDPLSQEGSTKGLLTIHKSLDSEDVKELMEVTRVWWLQKEEEKMKILKSEKKELELELGKTFEKSKQL